MDGTRHGIGDAYVEKGDSPRPFDLQERFVAKYRRVPCRTSEPNGQYSPQISSLPIAGAPAANQTPVTNERDDSHADHRERARVLADTYAERAPTEWFDRLYAEGIDGQSVIPWVDLDPNPNLVDWLDQAALSPSGQRALKVGCGLGDDVEELCERGFEVTAFDISPTAIEWCRERFPNSSATYRVADLFEAPADWHRAFDFVLESYILQVLPPAERAEAIRPIADFVRPGGTLLVITRGRDPDAPEGELPWPLTEETVRQFEAHGLDLVEFEDYVDGENPPVRRFRAAFGRPRGMDGGS
ncbi:MAG: SAM-dependent methyltransferase [Bacteroidetes bacterium SW_9_63_38]|nr:MAG: SAM-dependent methyltransferase [Bacteroidetes bacterium SW_9_63_38]